MLLFLQLQRNSSYGTSLNSLHEMSYEPRDLVSHSLRRNHGDLIADLLVRLKVESEFTVVFLDDFSAVVFHRFRSNTSLFIIVRVSGWFVETSFFAKKRERERDMDRFFVCELCLFRLVSSREQYFERTFNSSFETIIEVFNGTE